MDVFRNLHLQRALSLIVLFAALFSQIQMLYACDSMEGKPKRVCCCGEHDSVICPMASACAMHEKTADNSCCEINYSTLNDVGMLNSASTADCLALLLIGPQPPPVIDVQHFLPEPLPILSKFFPTTDEPLLISRGNQIYLFTHRLRL